MDNLDLNRVYTSRVFYSINKLFFVEYCFSLRYEIGCGESHYWPQFPVTLKTRVVEITYLIPIKP